MDSSQMGKKGGKSTLKKHGRLHFSKMGKARWKKNKIKKQKENI